MKKYSSIPGRGLNTENAAKDRVEYLKNIGIDIPLIADSRLDTKVIRYNVESYVGSIELPIGLAGGLLFNDNDTQEYTFAPIGTLEGALVASINRGAKAVSKSGGFNAIVIHQKMIRSPMFIFKNLKECSLFKNWVNQHFSDIKKVAESYSNHADLQTIDIVIASRSVSLKFIFTTGDASGQNMTTSCTWHAVLWIREHFVAEMNIEPVQYLIEGNGASDKKVSNYSLINGRGIHVIAECELSNEQIEKVLHVNPDDFVRSIHYSKNMSLLDGSMGYNINISNVIAGIFAATGQDLASIHESSLAVLNIEKTERGLYFSLNLPALVIGSLGGGTHLPKQKEALKMMGCYGVGKVQRFAKLIAGFALSLEISTASAIVGGQFAKAHESLGRNKPIDWLVKSEINSDFVADCMNGQLKNKELINVAFSNQKLVENGIIINLTNRINKKLTGFIPLEIGIKDQNTQVVEQKSLLLKSKPLDSEVIKGLHLMASSIDPSLSDLLFKYQDELEYKSCHLKEIQVYEALYQQKATCIPAFYGKKINEKRELYAFLQEFLSNDDISIINAENTPEQWTKKLNQSVIQTINQVHQSFQTQDIPETVTTFEPWKSKPLYQKFAQVLIKEYQGTDLEKLTFRLLDLIEDLEEEHAFINTNKVLIHNDFNPRNLAIRADNRVCIYDWELAVLNFPHRDIVEWLSFVLPLNFDQQEAITYLEYHYNLQENPASWEEWKKGYSYCLKEFLTTRVSFYLTGKILMDYPYAERVFANAFRLLDAINE